MNARLKIIFDELDFRLNKVLEQIKIVEGFEQDSFFVNEKRKRLYKEIAHYIHFILTTPELSEFFKLYLTYKNNLKSNPEFLNLNKRINDNIKKLGTNLFNKKDFEEKTKCVDKQVGSFCNPFEHLSLTHLSTKQFVDKMIEVDELKIWTFENFESVLHIVFGDTDGLNGILTYWKDFEQNKEFQDTSDEIFSLKVQMEYYYKFQPDYLEIENFEKLNEFHTALFPKFSIENLDSSIMKYLIKKGDDLSGNEFLKEAIESVNFRLKSSLNSESLVYYLIKKFKIYMEVYRLDDVIKEEEILLEKNFQREFERFLFLNNYYPLSESMLGNGRSDTLMQDQDSIILYEHKQIGFGKTKSTITKNVIVEAIRTSLTQITTYLGRMKSDFNLIKEGHVIIFTKKSFILKTETFSFNDYKVNFYIVDLSESPSKKKSIVIEDKDILNN